jgi:putative hydrolase of HD superfamily
MKRDVEFLFEVGALRHQSRLWHRFLGTDFANIADHHFRVAWLALIIASREGKGDTGRIVKLALMHDIAESRTGDVDYMSRQYVKRDEDGAMQDILDQTSLETEFSVLWKEYEARKTFESRAVKDADYLDVDLELREQNAKGITLEKDWLPTREQIFDGRFYTKAGRDLYDEIQKANPNDWHVTSSKNRLNGGDWKK